MFHVLVFLVCYRDLCSGKRDCRAAKRFRYKILITEAHRDCQADVPPLLYKPKIS